MKTLRSRYVRRVLVPLMAVTLPSACTQWKAQRMAPNQVVSEREPDEVRLTMVDDTEIRISEPQVVGDQIVGWRGPRWDTVRVAIDSVSYVSTPDHGKTVAAVILITGTLVFLAYVGAKAATPSWGR